MTRGNELQAGGGPVRPGGVTACLRVLRNRLQSPRNEEATMTINLNIPDIRELKPRITVFGTGGAGGNAVNNMITSGLVGVDFVVANTDAQALTMSKAERIIQMGVQVTEGLGAGSQPEVGRAAAEEVLDEIRDHLLGRAHGVRHRRHGWRHWHRRRPRGRALRARRWGSSRSAWSRSRFTSKACAGCASPIPAFRNCTRSSIRSLIIPNQNLFRVANEKTTFADAFAMADQVLYSGVACITDLMVKEGLINLDFADVRAVMREMGKAMMGTGEASGEKRALAAAEAAISNPLIDDASMKGARGLLISITGGKDLTLVRGRRSGNPYSRGSGSGRQHHRRRHLRREPRRHHPRVRGCDRHRSGLAAATAGRTPRRRGLRSSRRNCAPISSGSAEQDRAQRQRAWRCIRRRPALARARS